MNKLQKYSNLKVGDIVYIKPNRHADFVLHYNNINLTNKEDWSILAMIRDIYKPDHMEEKYNVIVTPISSNFGLIPQYPIQITNNEFSAYYTRPKDITVLSD